MKIGIYERVEVAVCASGMSLKKEEMKLSLSSWPPPLPPHPSSCRRSVRRSSVAGSSSAATASSRNHLKGVACLR